MRIRTYLILMALAILVPVILIAGIALRMLQQSEMATALHGLQESANGVSLLVDRELYSAEAALRVLGASPSLAQGDLQAFYVQAKLADRGPDGWTVLAGEDSQQLVNTLRPFGAPLPPPQERDLARIIIKAGKTMVSHVRPGPVSSRMVTTLTVPVTLDNGKTYLLNAVFNTDHFKHLIDTVQVPKGWIVGIIDGKGNFVARNINGEAMIGKPARPELLDAAGQSASGRIRQVTREGVEVYTAFTHSRLSNWTIAVAAPVEMVEQSARQASMVATFGMLAALLCAATVAFLLGGRHVAAIQRAAGAAVDLGHGKPAAPTHSTVSEVNELHQALHDAGQRLVQAQEYRQRAEAERQSLLEREQHARQLAETQNKAKDQFLAMLGHELRNPLAPISMAAELLKLPGVDEKRTRYTGEVITRQVEHMNSLLEDLLDVSRVTRGLVSLSMEPVDTGTIVSAAIEQVHGLVEAKGHRLELQLPSAPLWVKGDKTRLIQILINLLNNSAKYTEDGGVILLEVALETEQERDWVVLRVRDDGMGIAPDLLPRVFELFSQGERTLDRSQGGLGLGLALVKSLTELHGGSVSARSEGAGKGSTFSVRLPRIEEPVPAARTQPVVSPAGRRTAKIMVVDDNVDAARSLALFLQEAGAHSVNVFHDGAGALAHAADDPPDVFILDIGLPDMDGYALARRLRDMPQTAASMLIALTGYGQAQDMEHAKAAGFDHHLPKPAEPRRILDLLR